jgi:hypothetical protein
VTETTAIILALLALLAVAGGLEIARLVAHARYRRQVERENAAILDEVRDYARRHYGRPPVEK